MSKNIVADLLEDANFENQIQHKQQNHLSRPNLNIDCDRPTIFLYTKFNIPITTLLFIKIN